MCNELNRYLQKGFVVQHCSHWSDKSQGKRLSAKSQGKLREFQKWSGKFVIAGKVREKSGNIKKFRMCVRNSITYNEAAYH